METSVKIVVGASISPAEKALERLTRGLDKIEQQARNLLKPVALRLDTGRAEQQLRNLQRSINSLAGTQTVRVRVIQEVETRALGGSGGGGGGGAGMALLGAAAGAGMASRMGRALPPAGGTSGAPDPRIAGLLKSTEAEIKQLERATVLTGEAVRKLQQLNIQRNALLVAAGGRGGAGGGGGRGGGFLPPAAGGASGAGAAGGGGGLGRAKQDADGLASSLGRVAAAYVSIDAAMRAATATWQAGLGNAQALSRLQLLSSGLDDYSQVLRLVNTSAERFNLTQQASAEQVAQLYGRLRPMGFELDEIRSVFEGFNTAAKLSGASAAESAGALLQLSQALGANALRGAELNSVLEQAPLVAQAIARELNTTVGSLKQLAEDGVITSDVVVRALERIRTEGADKLAASLNTPAARLQTLAKRVNELQVAISNLALPTLLSSVEKLTGYLEKQAGFVTNLGDAWGYVATKLAPVIELLERGSKMRDFILSLTPLAAGVKGASLLQQGVAGLAELGRREAESKVYGPAAPSWYGPAPQLPPNRPSLKDRLGVAAADGKKDKNPTTKDELAAIARLAYGPQIIAAANSQNIDPRLLAGLVQVESGFNARARSSAGAIGLAQLMPGTARELGVNPYDPLQNLMGGARYLRQMINKFGSVPAGLRAYNQGPGNQQRYPGGVSAEAVAYPGKVLAAAKGFGFGSQGIADLSASGVEELLQAQEELIKQQQESFKEGQKLSQEFTRQLELRSAATEAERKLLQIGYDYADRQEQIKELVDSTQKTQLTALNNRIRELEVISAELDALYERAELERQITEEIGKRVKEMDTGGKFRTDIDLDPNKTQGKIQDYMDKLKTELADTEAMIVSLAQSIETELGSAMSNAIIGLVQGTQTVEQAMSTMFTNIGASFIDMATQMIAKALVMKVLGIFAGGGSSSLFSGAGPYQFPSGGGFNGFAPGLPKLFAEGGFVTGPTPAVFGEAGPEYAIPANRMPQAMANYAVGKRGAAVLEGGSEGGAAGGGGGVIRFESTVINGVEYVTREQAEAIGLQAADAGARRGASGGHARVMGDLRNRRSTRSRLGL